MADAQAGLESESDCYHDVLIRFRFPDFNEYGSLAEIDAVANLVRAGHPAAALHATRLGATERGARLGARLHRSCCAQLRSGIRSVRFVEETRLAGLNQFGAHLSACL